MRKALKILVICAIIFILLIAVILLASKKFSKTGEHSLAVNQKSNPLETKEFKRAENFIKKIYPVAYQKLEGNVQQSTQAEMDKLTKKFDTIVDEIDQVTLQQILPLADKVVVDKNKTDLQYAQEFKNAFADLTSLSFDVNNPQRLRDLSSAYGQKVEKFSRIRPSRNYHDFHIFWLTTSAAKAYVFSELAASPEPEKKYALLTLLTQVIAAEEKAIKFIQAQ